MTKKKIIVFAAVGAFLSGAVLFGINSDFSAIAQRIIRSTKQIENNWQYAAITRIYVNNPPANQPDKFIGNVEITYFSYNYDRVTTKQTFVKTECISNELNYAEFLSEFGYTKDTPQSQAAASARASDLALAKAMFTLGGRGWEITGRNFANFDFEALNPNTQYKHALYFRKLTGTKEAVDENYR
jgi:hypothetical protein